MGAGPTGGIDTHLLLVDLTPISPGFGLFAQEALDVTGVTVNRNTIPHEPVSPMHPSGIRLGTPKVASRGMKEAEMSPVARLVARSIEQIAGYEMPTAREERVTPLRAFRAESDKDANLARVRADVERLTDRLHLYPEINLHTTDGAGSTP